MVLTETSTTGYYAPLTGPSPMRRAALGLSAQILDPYILSLPLVTDTRKHKTPVNLRGGLWSETGGVKKGEVSSSSPFSL